MTTTKIDSEFFNLVVCTRDGMSNKQRKKYRTRENRIQIILRWSILLGVYGYLQPTYDSKTSHAQRLYLYNIILRSSEIRVEQFYNEICTSPRRYNYYNIIISMTIVRAYCGKVVVKQPLLPAHRIFSSLFKVR